MTLFSKLRARFFPAPRIYADYAASTPVSAEAIDTASRATFYVKGNPSSSHSEGRVARSLLEEARLRTARAISAHADEIIFTSGGTESNNLAILGALRAYKSGSAHAITSVIEHSSVLEPLRRAKEEGVLVSELSVDLDGHISTEELMKTLRPETVLVSIAYANGEIGSVEKIRNIARVLNKFREQMGRPSHGMPYFHTDASQAGLFLPLNPGDLGVDLMTIDASKLHGFVGSGFLYVRRGLSLEPLIYGGGQERGLRSGTENVVYALVLAESLEQASARRKSEDIRLRKLSKSFVQEVSKLIPEAKFNSNLEDGLPNIVNLTIPNLDAEFAAVRLDTLGVSVSSASACRSISANGASYVIDALPEKKGWGHSSLRFSFGRGSTHAEIVRLARILKKVAS